MESIEGVGRTIPNKAMKIAAKQRAEIFGTLVVLLLLSAVPALAQDLGEAARQERERKQNLAYHSTHVYTNEDLQRPHILVPEDQARMLAARKSANAQEVQATVKPSAVPATPAATASATSENPMRDRLPATASVPAQSATIPARPSAMLAVPDARKSRKSRGQISDFIFSNTLKKPVLAIPVEPKVDSDPAAGVQVARGDSLWKIAERHLGSGARWRELIALNPEVSDPNLIYAGEWIRFAAKDSGNAKQVVVRAGDTLTSVAQAEFGNARAFMCIAQANPQLETADRIYPGQTLILPQSCAVAR